MGKQKLTDQEKAERKRIRDQQDEDEYNRAGERGALFGDEDVAREDYDRVVEECKRLMQEYENLQKFLHTEQNEKETLHQKLKQEQIRFESENCLNLMMKSQIASLGAKIVNDQADNIKLRADAITMINNIQVCYESGNIKQARQLVFDTNWLLMMGEKMEKPKDE